MRHLVKRRHRKQDKSLKSDECRGTIDVLGAPCQRYKNLRILPGFYFYRPRHSAPVNATGFHVPASWHMPGKNWRAVWSALLRGATFCWEARKAESTQLDWILSTCESADIRHTMRDRHVLRERARVGIARGYSSHRSIARIFV